MKITKTCTFVLLKARNYLIFRGRYVNWKRKKDGENICFKALANRIQLTSELIRRPKKQQSCVWPTFYQKDFMKR